MSLWCTTRDPTNEAEWSSARPTTGMGGRYPVKQDDVARWGGLTLPVLIGRSKIMVTRTTPFIDSENVSSVPRIGSVNDGSPSSEIEGLPETPLLPSENPLPKSSPSSVTVPKKSLFFKPAARFQFTEKKWSNISIKPKEHKKHKINPEASEQLATPKEESMPSAKSLSTCANVPLSTGPVSASPVCDSAPESHSEWVVDHVTPCIDKTGCSENSAVPIEGLSGEERCSLDEDKLLRQDTISTFASSDADIPTYPTPSSTSSAGSAGSSSSVGGEDGSDESSDDPSETTSNVVTPQFRSLIDTAPSSFTQSGPRGFVQIVQGHWRTQRDTQVRVSGHQALWIRDSAIELGGTLSEHDGELRLQFSDGSIYSAELDESETVLKWSDGDVWKVDTNSEVAPTLIAPALSESFAQVLNGDQQATNPQRLARKLATQEPKLPLTLSHHNTVSPTHCQVKSPRNSVKAKVVNVSSSLEESCKERTCVPQIIPGKDGDLWLRFEDGRTYHAALQPEGSHLPWTGS